MPEGRQTVSELALLALRSVAENLDCGIESVEIFLEGGFLWPLNQFEPFLLSIDQ